MQLLYTNETAGHILGTGEGALQESKKKNYHMPVLLLPVPKTNAIYKNGTLLTAAHRIQQKPSAPKQKTENTTLLYSYVHTK